MHELPIMQNVLDIVLKYSQQNNATHVYRVNLAIGELSGIVSDWAQRYFAMISAGTIAEHAIINIEAIPAKIKCLACGSETVIQSVYTEFRCFKCKSMEVQMITGREFFIDSIEIS